MTTEDAYIKFECFPKNEPCGPAANIDTAMRFYRANTPGPTKAERKTRVTAFGLRERRIWMSTASPKADLCSHKAQPGFPRSSYPLLVQHKDMSA
eukprot:4968976-Heterocapsa_arctica.AAC.1